MEDRVLQIVLKARDEASKELEKVSSKAGGLSELLAGSFKNAAIVSGAALGALVAESVRAISAFSESEKVIAQTNAVIKSTGGVAGVTSEQVSYLAGRLQYLTGISDETIQSGENMLLTFTNIAKDIFPEATETMLDMSVALGQDVKNSAIQLGKALQDPILGVTALRRVGVNFSESQQDLIKSLVESGKLMEAQKFILKELQTEFGGSAEAAGKTFAGQMNRLKNSINDLEEVFGSLLTQALAPLIGKFQEIVDTVKNVIAGEEEISSLTQVLTTNFGKFGEILGKTIEFFVNNKDASIALAGAIGGVLMVSLVAATGAMLTFIGVSSPVLGVVGLIGAGVALMALNWGRLSETLSPVNEFLSKMFSSIGAEISQFVTVSAPAFSSAWDSIKNFLTFVFTIIKNIFETTLPALRLIFDGVWKSMEGSLKIVWGVMQVLISTGLAVLSGNWSNAWLGMKEGFRDIWDGLVVYLSGIWEQIKGIFKAGINSVIGLVNGLIESFNSVSGKLGAGSIGKIPSFSSGGYVPSTGLAYLHQGEFVLSKNMLEGRESSPAVSNFNQPITIGPVYVNDSSDIDLLSQQLAFRLSLR